MFRNTDATDPGIIRIPKTLTPKLVSFWNLILFGVIWWVLLILPVINFFWASFFTGLILAAAVAFGGITVEVVDYHGLLMFNPLTKERRAIFPGFHQKLLWESIEEGSLESLRRIVSSKGEENLPTNDPAENMKIHLTIHKRVNLSDNDKDAADNFIRFHSINVDSLTTVVRKEVVKKFSGYYGENEMENLIDADKVQEAVFPANPDLANDKAKGNLARIKEMEKNWGISIGLILDTSNPDDETKKLKRTPARAEALRSAMNRLTEEDKETGKRGLPLEKARRAALSLDETAEYSENHTTFDVKVNAPHLTNLRDVNIIPPGTLGGGKGSKK